MPLAIGAGLGLAGLGGSIFGQVSQEKQQRKALEQQEFLRNRAREKQLEQIQYLANPSSGAIAQRRLKALEEESMPVPLSQDPSFQAQRARLLSGGARELAGVANLQRAAGVSRGGFRNVGSLQDVQDRLGVALAGLAEKAKLARESKLEQAANLETAHIEFENARRRAAAAIEAGDTQSAIAALQQATALQQAGAQQRQQLFGNLLGMGGVLAGQGLQASQAQKDRDLLKQIYGIQ